MVIPCACSFLSASSRKAYSNGRALILHSLDLVELALGQRAGIGHEPADDGALAVVHMTDGDDVQALEVGGNGAHMYPPRRSDSRPPPSSLSWARPLRSAMLENLPLRSSSMISATFVAVESTGVVHG